MTTLKQTMSRFQPYVIAGAITLMGLIAFLGKSSLIIQFMDNISFETIDQRFIFRGAMPPGDHVAIATIDEKSLKEEGKWPWPRSKMADLVTKVSQAGARVLVFDINFSEESDKRLFEALSRLKHDIPPSNKGCLAYLDKLALESDDDARFARSIRESSASVVLGQFFYLDESPYMSDLAGNQNALEDLISSSQILETKGTLDSLENSGFIHALAPQPNIKILSDSTSYSGFINMRLDADGILRSMPVFISYGDLFYAHLSLKAVSAWTGEPIILTIGNENNIAIDIGEFHIPTDRNGRIMINYRGGAKTFPYLSITDILHDRIEPDVLKGKIIIVGATSTGLSDIRPTPFAKVFPGCEVHANLIDNILSRDLLNEPPLYGLWSVLAIAIAGLLLAVTLPHVGALPGLLVYVIAGIGYWGLCQYLFSRAGLVLDMTYPLTVLTLVYIALTANSYLTESKTKKFISDAFSTYVAPSVVKQLIKSPEKLGLGGEERHITAFFSDVQGFTSISEKLTPKELVELLNEFLTEMTNIILDHEGTVDKFEGDAIIAFFGAPITLENHAKQTCDACIAMHRRLAELNDKWKAENRPQLHMRIGLNSGNAVVGNMGSVNRMDYTMMGDVVNTAARLEGVNKIYGTYSLISESTKTLAGNAIITREIDTIYMVGKNEPVTVYQILGHPGSVDDVLLKSVATYEKGLTLYKSGRFDKALALFEQALGLNPGDGPASVMAKRCRHFMDHPPGEDWKGIFRITSK